MVKKKGRALDKQRALRGIRETIRRAKGHETTYIVCIVAYATPENTISGFSFYDGDCGEGMKGSACTLASASAMHLAQHAAKHSSNAPEFMEGMEMMAHKKDDPGAWQAAEAERRDELFREENPDLFDKPEEN